MQSFAPLGLEMLLIVGGVVAVLIVGAFFFYVVRSHYRSPQTPDTSGPADPPPVTEEPVGTRR